MGEYLVNLNETYEYMLDTHEDGYTFLGWFSENGILIVSRTIVETPRDQTLYAGWAEITSEKVEIVFMRIT